MSSKERRAEREEEFELESIEREKEKQRWNELSMYMKIDECVYNNKLKEILHLLAEKAGLE